MAAPGYNHYTGRSRQDRPQIPVSPLATRGREVVRSSQQSFQRRTGSESRSSSTSSVERGVPLHRGLNEDFSRLTIRPSANSQTNTSHPSSISQLSSWTQSELNDIQQIILRSEGIHPRTRDQLIEALRRLSQEFNSHQQHLSQEWDRRSNDQINLGRDLQAARQTVDMYRKKSEDQTTNSLKKYSTMEHEYQSRTQDLMEKIAAQEEQLKGKRALWLSTHKGKTPQTEARMAQALNDDPFTSPTPRSQYPVASSMDSLMSLPRTPLVAPPQPTFVGLQPPTGPRAGRRSNLPSGPARPLERIRTRVDIMRSQRLTSGRKDTYNGSVKLSPVTSTALALRDPENYPDPSGPYREAFRELFAMVEAWAKRFASVPNTENDREIATANQMVWDYMMNCTYPGERQLAHAHVLALLDDPEVRFWFVVRMAVAYFVKYVLNIDAFYNYSEETDNVLAHAKKGLEERGLVTERRQALIDQQHKTVKTIIESPAYAKFRTVQLNQHTKRLRDMLGPLLNSGCERAVAGKELGAMAIKAWDVSVKMHTSHLTFQIYFPETSTKFTIATMNSRDYPSENPNALQARQARIKLVMTPVITLRDDRSTTIRVKNLQIADVLLMA